MIGHTDSSAECPGEASITAPTEPSMPRRNDACGISSRKVDAQNTTASRNSEPTTASVSAYRAKFGDACVTGDELRQDRQIERRHLRVGDVAKSLPGGRQPLAPAIAACSAIGVG